MQTGGRVWRQTEGQCVLILEDQTEIAEPRSEVQDMRVGLDLEIERLAFCVDQA